MPAHVYFCVMRTWIACFFLFVICSGVRAQLPDSLRMHLDSAIYFMRAHSLYAGKVNWSKATKEAGVLAAKATTKEQLYPAIAHVFRQLNDHHGMFAQYNDVLRLPDSTPVKRLTKNILDEWAKGWRIKTAMIGDIAYLRIPGMPVNSPGLIEKYANWLADSVAVLASNKPAGWIIDLRMNTGGNILPMMSALAGFFEDGKLSFSIDRKGKVTGWASVRDGIFYQEDTLRTRLKAPVPSLQHVNVAVLIGAGTASSGEITAIHFQQRNRTKLFGEQTAGVANATEGFVFNHDKSYLLLTTAAMANKSGKKLPAFVLPAKTVKNNDMFTQLSLSLIHI